MPLIQKCKVPYGGWQSLCFNSLLVVGCHQGLLCRQVSMSLQISLAFGIFVSGNGKVSWSMWTFHLRTSFDSLFLLFIQNWNSICTQIPFALHFNLCLHLCCDILNFVDFFFPLFCKSLVMENGLTCSLAIWSKLCITSGCSSWKNVALVCL